MKKKLLVITLGLSVLMLSSCQKQDLIGMDKAKEIALSNANLTESQVNFIETDTDRDDGRTVYEIEFYTDDFTEYDYKIDAATGEIVSFDTDAEGVIRASESKPASETEQNPQPQQDSAAVTEEEVKSKVIERVPGATEENITKFKIDYDDGTKQYEGKIVFEKTEYEFEVDATTGEITSWESESVFD